MAKKALKAVDAKTVVGTGRRPRNTEGAQWADAIASLKVGQAVVIPCRQLKLSSYITTVKVRSSPLRFRTQRLSANETAVVREA